MSNLLDMAADDLENVFLNESDFAVRAILRPHGRGDGGELVCQIFRPGQSQEEGDVVLAVAQNITAVCMRSAARQLIEQLEGAARDPGMGDTLTDGVGELVVEKSDTDDVGGLVISLKDPRAVTAGTRGIGG